MILFSSYIPSGTATVTVNQDVYAVNVRVTNFLGERETNLDEKKLDVSKAPPPRPFVRYYLRGISRFHRSNLVGHLYTHLGEIAGQSQRAMPDQIIFTLSTKIKDQIVYILPMLWTLMVMIKFMHGKVLGGI